MAGVLAQRWWGATYGCRLADIIFVIIIVVITWWDKFMVKLKLTTVGSSTGVVLPKEVLARLKVEKGDTVFLTDAPDGYRITPYDPEFEQQMELARRVMRERRNVLKELAK
jgi:putative addiction module antidote